MPKMKSNKSATKRFKLKKGGSIKRGSAYRSHILTKMSNKRKRNLRNPQSIHEADVKNVKKMMCV